MICRCTPIDARRLLQRFHGFAHPAPWGVMGANLHTCPGEGPRTP